MHIRKAVITAAGRGMRLYPVANTVQKAMLPIVDRDGLTKPVMQIIAEEAFASGIDDICVVCAPGDETHYRDQFRALRANLLTAHQGVEWADAQRQCIDRLLGSLHFAVQADPLGYGHAVACARDFCGDEAFLLLLSDHVYVSHAAQRCAQQVIALAQQTRGPVAAVQATREHLIRNYGTLTGRHEPNFSQVYRIERILEKPSITLAETTLVTPGLRAGHYLCFFGMHVLVPRLFALLERQLAGAAQGPNDYQLTPALHELATQERYLALEVRGARYDIGQTYGLLQAQIALGLAGAHRDRVLTTLTEQLLERQGREG
jgi:UTP--glucose-1-phosphate uridylyltransferase